MLPTFENLATGLIFEYKCKQIPVVEVVYYSGSKVIGKDFDISLDVWHEDVFRITGFIPNSTRLLVRVTDRKSGGNSGLCTSLGTTYTLEYDKVKEHANIINMISDKDCIDPASIIVGRTMHLSHVALDEAASELVNYMGKDEFRDLRRLAMYGVKLLIFDIYEHKFKDGHTEDVTEITTTCDSHGFWTFPKKYLPQLIKQWAI